MTQDSAIAQLAAPEPLAPPVTLTAPDPVAVVPATSAPKMAPPVAPEKMPALDAKVDSYLTGLLATPTSSPQFATRAADVSTMGDADIRHAASSSSRLLQAPVKALSEGGLASGSKVGNTLLDLRRTVEDLDPSGLKGARKILGFIPMGDKAVDYFRKYQSAESHLNAILHALRDGQDELRKDNVALNLEKAELWATMGTLNEYVYVAERLDVQLSAQIADLEATDPERARALRDDVLFYVRQKHQDLLQQLTTSIMGYLSIDILMRSNTELIKGVDRSTTTTVDALRTAIIVSQALSNQQLVLNQITALNTTTSGLIERTSVMLKENSLRIQQQAASSTLSLESLQTAFSNIYATLDSIDTFKGEALTSMATTIGSLQTEVDKAQGYLARVQQHDERVAAGSLDLAGGR